jgi:hypothetical protein
MNCVAILHMKITKQIKLIFIKYYNLSSFVRNNNNKNTKIIIKIKYYILKTR